LWKELFVDFDETLKLDDFFVCVGGIENEKWIWGHFRVCKVWYTNLLREETVGTIFEKSFMPLSNFLFCDCENEKEYF
jgi:hypothetical protein